jgi:hypothetical protein
MSGEVMPALEGLELGDGIVVGKSCEGSKGVWICASHRQTFVHNLAKDSHCAEPGRHLLVWQCAEHGPETP